MSRIRVTLNTAYSMFFSMATFDSRQNRSPLRQVARLSAEVPNHRSVKARIPGGFTQKPVGIPALTWVHSNECVVRSIDAIGASGGSNEGKACGAELDYLAIATWVAFKQARLRLDRLKMSISVASGACNTRLSLHLDRSDKDRYKAIRSCTSY
ncbi:hypothetical protein [Bradyrhizobium sacchari]|uniref:hypothetical protein n=1 Tax=Bradyrhizobium sacchari TaxID=1399419 RepID=UPI0013747463|nr:hypothetical protein [Bradyrhizobium sacchari]